MFGLMCHQYKPLTERVSFLRLWNILNSITNMLILKQNKKKNESNVYNIFRYGTEHLLFTPSIDKDRAPATYNSLFCIVQ